jgi:anaerobic magnesium-protoporphyrin IX monomethyl ester cyclase
MKVVLVNPPQTLPAKSVGVLEARAHPPLSLLYLAAVVEKMGVEVCIVDALVTGEELLFHEGEYLHFGAPWPTLRRIIADLKPDIVGITSPFTSQLGNALKTADLIKDIGPDIPVIVGGPHAAVSPNDFLADTNIDVVAIGEGETILPELVRHYQGSGQDLGKIKGIAYRNPRGEIVVNERAIAIDNLDEIPLPAYHLLNMEDYFRVHKKGFKGRSYASVTQTMPVITSRGCPFNCCFCSVHLHIGRKWRPHSPAYVIEHLKLLKEKYGIRHIDFEDDNLNLNEKRFEDILDMMIAEKLGLTWNTPNGVRGDLLNEKLISKMKASGCLRLTIAPESGDQDTLDNIIDKKLDLKKIIASAGLLKKYKIATHAYYVVGFPGETPEKMQNTFDFAAMLLKKYDVVPSVTMASPLIGTRLYVESKKAGYLIKEPTPEDILLGSHPGSPGLIKTGEFTPESVRGAISKFYRRVFLIALFKAPVLIIRDPKAALEKAKGLLKLAAG